MPKEKPVVPVWYESLKMCAASCGCTPKFLSVLRSSGCAGFEAHRVNILKLVGGFEKWLSRQPEEDKELLFKEGVASWEQLRSKYMALGEQARTQQSLGELMLKSDALEVAQTAQSIYFAQLDRMVIELPARMAGRDAAALKQFAERYRIQVRSAVENELLELERKYNAEDR